MAFSSQLRRRRAPGIHPGSYRVSTPHSVRSHKGLELRTNDSRIARLERLQLGSSEPGGGGLARRT